MASSIGSHLVQQSVECVRDEILILVPRDFGDVSRARARASTLPILPILVGIIMFGFNAA